MKLVKRGLFLAIAGCLLVASPSIASENPRGDLVDADWLSKNLGRPDLVLLDLSPGQRAVEVGGARIPGDAGGAACPGEGLLQD